MAFRGHSKVLVKFRVQMLFWGAQGRPKTHKGSLRRGAMMFEAACSARLGMGPEFQRVLFRVEILRPSLALCEILFGSATKGAIVWVLN